jgi:hypothetical protein
MWAYLGSTSTDRPSPEELCAVEEESQIHKVLDSTTVTPLGTGPEPLQRGIANVWVGTSGPVIAAFTILSLHWLVILCRVSGITMVTHGALISLRMPQGGQRAMPLMGPHGHMKRERERDRCTTGRVARKWVTGTLTESVSSGEGEMDQGVTWPPSPPPRMSSSQSWGMGSRQAGPLVGECRSKCFRAACKPPFGLSE